MLKYKTIYHNSTCSVRTHSQTLYTHACNFLSVYQTWLLMAELYPVRSS